MMHRVKVSRLVRHVEVYDVKLEDESSAHHLATDHPEQFAVDLEAGEFEIVQPVSSSQEELAFNELSVEVVDREPATVIPMRRRDG
jgi:hypothetical protein